MAGSWLMASVCTERTKQSSSAMAAVWGRSSLTHAPLSPCRAKRKTDGATGKRFWPDVMVVRRWPARIDSGRSSSKRSAMAGLGSKRSVWDGPPDW